MKTLIAYCFVFALLLFTVGFVVGHRWDRWKKPKPTTQNINIHSFVPDYESYERTENIYVYESPVMSNLRPLRLRFDPYKYNKCKMIFYKSTDNTTWLVDTQFTAETMRLFIDTTEASTKKGKKKYTSATRHEAVKQ